MSLFRKEEVKLKTEFEKVKLNINLDEMLDKTIEHFTSVNTGAFSKVQRGIKTKESLLNDVVSYLKMNKLNEGEIEEVKEKFEKYMWGYHILEELIDDETISDIKIINKDTVRIKKHGKRLTSNIKFSSDDELKRFVNVVAVKNKTNVAEINAIQNFTDKTSNNKFILRFNIATEYVNSVSTPYLHIRKIPKIKYTMDKLIEFGMLTREQAEFLINKAKNGDGIIFTGKGASGKTTLMNVLLEEIPHNKSGLVIQENEELFSNEHPDLMFQKVRTSRGEGKIQYTLKDLSINGLLTDLDYFIIGEIKGAEALYFLNAAYTGHRCWASVHGVNSTQAIDKLVDYMKYESDYSKEDLMKMLRSLDTVVFMKDFKAQEITEIVGYDETKKELIYNKVFEGSKKIGKSCR